MSLASRLLLSFALAAFAAPSPAQARQVPQRSSRPALLVQMGPVVTGAPLSAIRVLDFTPAPGSSESPIHGEEKFFRDSSGRTRSEVSYDGGPARINIVDHVAHVRFRWIEGSGTVEKFTLKDYPVAEKKTDTLPADAPRIEGIPTRYSRGMERNDPSADVENWYAPELQLALATVIDKPGVGKSKYQFTHIKREEPAASLFAAPAGLAVVEGGAPPPPPALRSDAPAPATTASSPDTSRPTPAYAGDPKFQKALADTRFKGPLSTQDRADRWKKASKLAKGECIDCLVQLLRFQMMAAAYKDAVASADQLDHVATEPADKVYAEVSGGQALMHSNFDEPKPADVQKAEAFFSSALKLSPNSKSALFEEGRALAHLNRDAEAKAVFQRYVDQTPDSDHYHLRAEHFVDNPHLAAMPMAPPFKLITAQGEEIQLDDMHGKVVLLDFWATWCGPCRESLPDIQRIAHDFKDEPLVVISISQDNDAQAWQKYVQSNHMDWPQYRDAGFALSRAYGVNAIPHFFTIDTNGVLQTELVGSNADVRGKLKKLLKQAHEAQAKTQLAQGQ